MYVIYIVFGWTMVFVAVCVLIQGFANWRFVRERIRRVRPPNGFTPSVALICPCCGLDRGLEQNLRSLLNQDYPDYRVIFVVADRDDPAVTVIGRLLDEFPSQQGQLVVAGKARYCSQMNHNQLEGIRQGSRDATILVVVDSDLHPGPHWLRYLVDPLADPSVGEVTGYRWYIPVHQDLPSIFLSAINGIPACAYGPHNMNYAWGGTFALRREYFDRLKIADLWAKAICDDMPLSIATKKAGYKIVFEPRCYCASQDIVTWRRMFDFVYRQFLCVRTCALRLWILALAGTLQYTLVFWPGLVLTIWALVTGHPHLHWIWPVPLIAYASNVVKGFIRRSIAFRVFPDDRNNLSLPSWLDTWASPLVNLAMLFSIVASGLSKTMVWRNITYRLHRTDNIEVIRPS